MDSGWKWFCSWAFSVVPDRIFALIARVYLRLQEVDASRWTYLGVSSEEYEQWESYKVDGGPACSDGSPFRFYLKKGRDPRHLVLHFAGGGTCWNKTTCGDSLATSIFNFSFYTRTLDDFSLPRGWYEEPLKDATVVAIPYCTGDLYVGNQVQFYPDVVYHVGAQNTAAVLNWLSTAFEASPQKVLLTGCSAGGYGALFYGQAIGDLFPQAAVSVVAEGALGVISRSFVRSAIDNWNPITDLLQETQHADGTDIITSVVMQTPEVHYALVNGNTDSIQMLYYGASAVDLELLMVDTLLSFMFQLLPSEFPTDLHSVTIADFLSLDFIKRTSAYWKTQSQRAIESWKGSVSNLHVYTYEGTEHCRLLSNNFSERKTGIQQQPLDAWLADFVAAPRRVPASCTPESCGAF